MIVDLQKEIQEKVKRAKNWSSIKRHSTMQEILKEKCTTNFDNCRQKMDELYHVSLRGYQKGNQEKIHETYRKSGRKNRANDSR